MNTLFQCVHFFVPALVQSFVLVAAMLSAVAQAQVTITYTYDELDRLDTVFRSDGPQLSYGLDVVGNVASAAVTQSPDTDGDQQGDFADLDDDNDGMPDEWELLYGLNPLDASDATQDPDGDGRDNLQEFIDGTNPLVIDEPSVEVNVPIFPLWALVLLGSLLFAVFRLNAKTRYIASIALTGLVLSFLSMESVRANPEPGWYYVDPISTQSTLEPGWHSLNAKSVSPNDAKRILNTNSSAQNELGSNTTNSVSIGGLGQAHQKVAEYRADVTAIFPEEVTHVFGYDVSSQSNSEGTAIDGTESLTSASTVISAESELSQLAEALGNDPLKIYLFVKNNIDYIPYFGALKGAQLTYIERAGNDFDQAALLTELFREAGYLANYRIGEMTIPAHTSTGYNFGNMIGVTGLVPYVEHVLSLGGVPLSTNGNLITVTRAWVEIRIDGVWHYLDPTLKRYSDSNGINLGSAMGYSRSALLSAVQGTSGANYVQNLNEAGLSNELLQLSNNLITYLKANYPNASVDDILNSRKIIPESPTTLPQTIPFSSTSTRYVEIPEQYHHTINIDHIGIDMPLSISKIAGKKLSISYVNDTSIPNDVMEFGVLERNEISPVISRMIGNAAVDATVRVYKKGGDAGFFNVSINGSPQSEFQDILWPVDGHINLDVEMNTSFSSTGRKYATLIFEANFHGFTKVAFSIDLSGVIGHSPENYNFTDIDYAFDLGHINVGQATQPLTDQAGESTGTIYVIGSGFEVRLNGQHIQPNGHLNYSIPAGQIWDLTYRLDPANTGGGRKHAKIVAIQNFPRISAPVVGVIHLTGTIGQNPSDALRPILYLDDEYLDSGSNTTLSTQDLILSIDHPYADDNGSAGDQSATYQVHKGGHYVLVSGFGTDQRSELLERSQRELDTLRSSGFSDSSRQVLSSSLHMMGQTWMQQTALNNSLMAQMEDILFIQHHRFGLVGQEQGYFIDVKNQLVSTADRNNATRRRDYFRSRSFLNSALEHGVLEQLQLGNNAAVSTIKLLKLTNQQGGRIYDATSDTWESVQPNLVNYSTSDINNFESLMTDQTVNGRLIIPANGAIALNDWAGKGYVEYRELVDGSARSLSMRIGGDYFGGYAASEEPLNIPWAVEESISERQPPSNIATPLAADPVDLGSGAFVTEMTDIALGSSGSRGLAFTRSYNSRQSSQNTAGLGRGWTHNYNMSINSHSNVEAGMGLRAPLDSVAMLVANYVTLDLMADEPPTLPEWTAAALTADWAMDELLNNAVSINLGTEVMTFIQFPNGDYCPPEGVTVTLQENGGTFQAIERFGTTYSFNSNDKIANITDIDGNALTFTYSGNNLNRVTDAFGRYISLNYTGSRLASVSDSTGRSVSYSQTNNELRTVTGLENAQWQYTYDSLDQILTVTDPVGTTIVNNTYDELGRVTQQVAPRQNGSAIYKMHYTGLSASEEAPDGSRVTYHYNDRKRTVATEDAEGSLNRSQYDGQGHVIMQIDPRGNETEQQFDGNNNLVMLIDANDDETDFEYDAQHRLIRTTDAFDHSTETDYDTEHHPTHVRDALDNEIETSYRADGLPATTTNARDVVTTFTYDTTGFVDTTKTGTQPVVDTAYDALGRMTSLTDQAGATTSFVYDDRGLVTQRTDALNKTTTNVYNALGLLASQTDREGDTTTMTYTPTSKVNTISYPEKASPFIVGISAPAFTVSYTYDNKDRLTQMTDQLGNTVNTYDTLDRLTSHTDPNGHQVQYAYDAASNITQLTYPDGNTVSYQYDALNRISNVSIDWLSVNASPSYDAAGRLTGISHFNGTSTTYGYDAANRLTGLAHYSSNNNVLADYQYTLDANGNRTQAVITNEPILPAAMINAVHNQTYNPQKNRVTSLNNNGEMIDLNYDERGQIHIKDSDIGTDAGFAYDAAGRVTLGVESGSVNLYSYDGAGNRLSAIRNGVMLQYVYDANGNLLTEMDSQGNIQKYFIYGLGLMAMVDANTNKMYVYHFDGTGHTVAMTDGNENITHRYAYAPFGQILAEEEAISQPFKYAGQVGIMHEFTSVYYMRARYYDAELRQFISEDPAGFVDGPNLYAYVGGNPVTFVDPSGLSADYLSQVKSFASGAASYFGDVARAVVTGASFACEGFSSVCAQNVANSRRVGSALYDYNNNSDVRAQVQRANELGTQAFFNDASLQASFFGRGTITTIVGTTGPVGLGLNSLAITGGALRASESGGNVAEIIQTGIGLKR